MIAVPGAIVMINHDISQSMQAQLETQLHISETISSQEFSLRFAADQNYPGNVRILSQRLLVIQDFSQRNDSSTIAIVEEMDIVLFIKNGLASVEKNCFCQPGQTIAVKDINWGAICIHDTNLNRRCNSSTCCCNASSDGYGQTPYYPATYDPNFPAENHDYYQSSSTGTFGCSCSDSEYTLCGTYYCNSSGCIPLTDCRLVKAVR